MVSSRLSSSLRGAAAVAFAAAVLTVAACVAALRFSPFPQLDAFLARPYSVEILDRNGTPIGAAHREDGTRRYRIRLDELPESLLAATLAAEDRRFFVHPGVDPAAVARAAAGNLRRGATVSGASTISMQLARLVAPHSGGISGKAAETWNALRLEARLTKSDLLELYLNTVPYGAGAEGVEAAARRYFGRSATALTAEEALLLSVVPRRPAHLHPHRNPERLAATALPVAERAGIATDRGGLLEAALAAQQWDAGRTSSAAAPGAAGGIARAGHPPSPRYEPPATADGERDGARQGEPFEAPHYVQRVARSLSAGERAAGFPIHTTVDLRMQHALEDRLRESVREARFSRIRNAAGVVLDHRSGEILAYAGSADYFDEHHGGMIDAVRIRRKSGSTLKPFLYALAMEHGYTAASILPDLPQSFGDEEAYIPRNFSNTHAGPVRLRTALASSLNVPAVHTVVDIGVDRFVDTLDELGFASASIQREEVGPGIAVGNLEVTLLELTRAFSVFAGARTDIFSEATTQIIRDILADGAERALGFGLDSVLDTPFPTIAKTGTANQFSDIWAVVTDPRLTVGIWMGNVDGSTVIGSPGSSFPALAAVQFLEHFHEPGSTFPPADAVHTVMISPVSGMRYNPPDGIGIPELFPEGFYPPRDTWHTSAGGPVRYPPEYRAWAQARRAGTTDGTAAGDIADNPGARTAPAISQSPGATPSTLRINSPPSGARFYRDPRIGETQQRIAVEVTSDGHTLIRLYWNGSLAAEGLAPLHVRLPLTPGRQTLTARSADLEDSVIFEVASYSLRNR